MHITEGIDVYYTSAAVLSVMYMSGLWRSLYCSHTSIIKLHNLCLVTVTSHIFKSIKSMYLLCTVYLKETAILIPLSNLHSTSTFSNIYILLLDITKP
jgi:hypothetical protein